MNGLVDAAALKVSGLGIEARPPAPMMHHYAAAALGTTHPERMHRRRKPSHGKGSAGTQASAGLAVRTREILHPAVMNPLLTVIDPAAPRCRNPIAIAANRVEYD
jgi:hypothetical protein